MSKNKLSPIRRAQKMLMDSTAAASDATSAVFIKTGKQMQKLDEQLHLSERVRGTGKDIRAGASKIDEKYGLSEIAAETGKAFCESRCGRLASSP